MFFPAGSRSLLERCPPRALRRLDHAPGLLPANRADHVSYIRHVDDLKLRDVRITWETPEKPDWGSAVRCVNVGNLEIAGFAGRQARGSPAPAIPLRDTRHAYIDDCWAPEETGAFLGLEAGTRDVALMNNDLSRAGQAVSFASGTDSKELFQSGNRPPVHTNFGDRLACPEGTDECVPCGHTSLSPSGHTSLNFHAKA